MQTEIYLIYQNIDVVCDTKVPVALNSEKYWKKIKTFKGEQNLTEACFLWLKNWARCLGSQNLLLAHISKFQGHENMNFRLFFTI